MVIPPSNAENHRGVMKEGTDFKVAQLAVGGLDDNFSYVVFDAVSGDSAIVDPCGDVEMIKRCLDTLGETRPRYILITHGHHDHTSGIDSARRFFDAPLVAHSSGPLKADIAVRDHHRLEFGEGFIECIFAPGHSRDGMLYRLSDDSALFTGDTLFIDWCGYCVADSMFKTMREIIWPLADSNIVYSGHNYGRVPYASLGEEKKKNPYLATVDFVTFKKLLKRL